MKRRRGLATIALLASLIALATAARAGGVEDGEAGLQALARGSYEEAIRLFTKALHAGDLSQDDREFAYLNRGKAYLGRGDRAAAIADLREAARLKPDDADAAAALSGALASETPGGVGSTDTQSATSGPWGLLGDMANHDYWYEVPGADPHHLVLLIQWATRNKTLTFSIRGKDGLHQIGEYQIDDATGKLLFAAWAGNTPFYGTVDASATRVSKYAYYKSMPTQDLTVRAADGSLSEHAQQFSDGAWHDAGDALLVEVSSEETLEVQDILKKK